MLLSSDGRQTRVAKSKRTCSTVPQHTPSASRRPASLILMAPAKSSKKKQRLEKLERQLQKELFGQEEDIVKHEEVEETFAEGEDGDDPESEPSVTAPSYPDLGHEYWKKQQQKRNNESESVSNDSDTDDELVSENVVVKPEKKPVEKAVKESVWTDPDDDITAAVGLSNTTMYPKRITAESKFKSFQKDKFTSLYKRPKWADGAVSKNESDSDEDGDSLSNFAGKLIAKKNTLSRGTLMFNKCTALNADFSRSHGYCSMQFHPKYEIGIVSDRKSVDFFKLEDRGKQSENRLIKSYDFNGRHIEMIRVTSDGRELIIGMTYPDSNTYSIDMTTGQTSSFSLTRGSERIGMRGMCLSPDGLLIACCCENGRIFVMDAKVKEFIRSMKMNDDVKCICFSADSRHLFSHGMGGQVYIWDVKQERLVNKFYDEGAVTGTALSASPNGQFLAAGSESGVVNVYDVKTCEREDVPKPLKSLMNLTTEISSISFNHSSELFSFCSRLKQNAVRLAHVPSRSVYSNFPYQEEHYGRVAEMNFSPSSGFAGMATNQRSVNLFRVCHFARY